ncbi:hypothetical protein FACS189485_22890 [Spirochaetia bacterium]|nr:hypothetical protein FACS189485_22890 [Spirochaetia bacterium]
MRKTFCCLLLVLSALTGILSCSKDDSDTRLSVDRWGKTVVERYGQLKVSGTQLLNAAGRPVQLRGVSSFGLQYEGQYANEDVIRWLRDDWNMQIWRAAMYTAEGGYISRSAVKSRVTDSVEAAIKLGIYVIIDWHILSDGDPRIYQKQAVEFFSEMAERYGQYPNLIYEICNEPNGRDVTWAGSVKPYAEAVIAAIRARDPDNIIIVGTPTWSQDVDIAAASPITGYENIMYSLHFYAGTHGSALQRKAEIALSRGIALFVTECGTSQATGNDGVYEAETLQWFSFLQKHNISWINWSLTNKGESSGILAKGADRTGKGHWTDSELSQSGKFIRKIMRNETQIK